MSKPTDTNKEDLKETLSPISYAVTQENATERPFTGKYDDFMKKGSMSILSAANRFSVLQRNMMQAVAGQLSANPSAEKTSKKKRIFLMGCTESK